MTDLSSSSVRTRGKVLVACGLFLIAIMVGVTITLYPTLTAVGKATASGTSFTGTAAQGQEILRLFYAVIVYGVMTMIIGIFNIVNGRASRIRYFLMLAGAAGLLYLGRSLTQSLGN